MDDRVTRARRHQDVERGNYPETMTGSMAWRRVRVLLSAAYIEVSTVKKN